MHSFRIVALHALYELTFLPIIYAVVGLPVTGLVPHPQFTPVWPYVVFGLVSALAETALPFVAFRRVRAEYTTRKVVAAFAVTAALTVAMLCVLRPLVLGISPAVAIAAGVGFAGCCVPLALVAATRNIHRNADWHLLVLPSIVQIAPVVFSAVLGSWDLREVWKYFPTPALMVFPFAGFLANAYRFFWYYVLENKPQWL